MSKVRVVLAWLTRGTWTYNHKLESHAIGTDLDLYILDPSGNRIAESLSFDNSFEVATFSPSGPGNYIARIDRYTNRDQSDSVFGIIVNRND